MLCFSLGVVSLSHDELCDLLCLVAQQATGIPLCQQLYAPSNNVACFRSFLIDSLHVSSGLRKLLLNIISPLSHF